MALITPAVITLSCSHLLNKHEALSPYQENLLISYQTAKALETNDAAQSCSLYKGLSQETFPLKELALIRAHLVCADPINLAKVTDLSSQPWLAELELDRRIHEAEKSKDPRSLAKAQLSKAETSDLLREKVQWLEEASGNAQQIENPTPEDKKLQAEIRSYLLKLSPRLLPNPGPGDYFNVANDWFLHRDFKKGRKFLQKIIYQKGHKFSLEEQYQARRLYRNSFKTEQKKTEHVKEAGSFARWNEKKSSPSRIHEAYVTWARADWTLGNASSAQRILSRAENILKKKHSLDEIYFIRSRMAEERKNSDEALNFLSKAETENKGDRPLRDKILFSRAWILRKKAQYLEAADALRHLKNETTDPFDKNRYMFWLARSLKQAGKAEEAQHELKELIQNDPLGYYGLVAYRELNTEMPALTFERKPADQESRPAQVSSEDFQTIRALLTVQEYKILESFLDFRAAEMKAQGQKDLQAWLYYLKAYANAGLYNPLFRQVGGLPAELKATLLAQNPELLFPRDFLDLITTNAEKFKVRPELMLSIIRQESAFNPNARSPADAFGLMQVIPQVAKIHEKATGIQVEHFEELYRPEINIPVGAALLADLDKKYRGQFVLTAAAYNASERAIEGWLKTRLQDDPLEFIEDIPYEETKAYVKLVLRNFIFYSRLSKPGETLAFPNWCLDDLQSFKVSTR